MMKTKINDKANLIKRLHWFYFEFKTKKKINSLAQMKYKIENNNDSNNNTHNKLK
jgi:hypothetical protein